MDAREWLQMFQEVSDSLQKTQMEVLQYNQNGGSIRAKRTLSKKIAKSKEEVLILQKGLAKMEHNPMEHGIGSGEVRRRKGMLTNLNTLVHNVDDDMNSSQYASADRGTLKNGPQENDETLTKDNQGLYEQQQQAVKEQDEKLDNIYEGVSKLKYMSQGINTELGMHENLLDDLHEAVERTDRHMVMNTKGVDHVNRKSRGCCGVIIIFLLMVIIVLVAATDYWCVIFKPDADRCKKM